MKVPFKMPEIFSHTLGGGLEIWATIYVNDVIASDNHVTYFNLSYESKFTS